MAQSLAVNLVENIVHERVGDISILVIDDDNTSNVTLTSILEKFSYKVISVKVASEAVSMIERQKDIGLVIANIELPHIDSHSFLTTLLHKDIPLILITPEIMTKKTSDSLTKATRFCLKKPILENDIENLWQHVLPKKSQVSEKFNIAEKQKIVMTEDTKQIEAFMENIKRPRTSQASLLGRRKYMKAFTTSEMYQKRRSVENAEWKTKPVCPIEIENKGRKGEKVEINIGSRSDLWTFERHMKFLAAISILGEESSRPKSILRIMNDSSLTHRHISSHLQNYKAQIERINETLPRNEWISTEKTFKYLSNYEYPFKASNLTKNLIESNSLWYSLKKKKSTQSSIAQFFFEKPSERKETTPNLHLGGKPDLTTPSLFSNILNNSAIEAPSTTSNNPPYNIPSTNDVNHSGLVSTSFSSDKLPGPPSLPSSVGASNTDTRICFPKSDPKPMQSSTSVLETDMNPLDIDPISILNSCVFQTDHCIVGENYFLPDYTMNPLETNIDQIGWIPSSLEENSHHETNMNHTDWIPSTENYVHPEADMKIISLETNTTQTGGAFSREGCVRCETNDDVLDSMTPRETNKGDVGLVPFEESDDVPIEDLISFDIDVNEMDMDVWLENYDTFEKNIHFSTGNLENDLPSNTQVGSISQISMEGQDNPLAMHQKEGMNGEDSVEIGRKNLDLIDEILSED